LARESTSDLLDFQLDKYRCSLEEAV